MGILGLEAILYQNQDGIDRVIGYVSRALSKTEHKFPAHKLKFVSICICKLSHLLFSLTFLSDLMKWPKHEGSESLSSII